MAVEAGHAGPSGQSAADEQKAYYERFTGYLIRDRLRDNPRHLWIRGLLNDLFSRRRFESALDVGCGAGILTAFIRKRVPIVWGFDLSENNIRFAKATVPGVEFRAADLTREPLPRRFDLITAFDVLEHIPPEEKKSFLHRLMDHAAAGGWILLTIPTPEYLEYQRRHAPELLQIIDVSVSATELTAMLEGRMEIRECRNYGIDYVDQYKYYLLASREGEFTLRTSPDEGSGIWWKIRGRAQFLVRSILFRKKYERIARQALQKDTAIGRDS